MQPRRGRTARHGVLGTAEFGEFLLKLTYFWPLGEKWGL